MIKVIVFIFISLFQKSFYKILDTQCSNIGMRKFFQHEKVIEKSKLTKDYISYFRLEKITNFTLETVVRDNVANWHKF